jgi:hypothetical protein
VLFLVFLLSYHVSFFFLFGLRGFYGREGEHYLDIGVGRTRSSSLLASLPPLVGQTHTLLHIRVVVFGLFGALFSSFFPFRGSILLFILSWGTEIYIPNQGKRVAFSSSLFSLYPLTSFFL